LLLRCSLLFLWLWTSVGGPTLRELIEHLPMVFNRCITANEPAITALNHVLALLQVAAPDGMAKN